jgi:hypothetical protein
MTYPRDEQQRPVSSDEQQLMRLTIAGLHLNDSIHEAAMDNDGVTVALLKQLRATCWLHHARVLSRIQSNVIGV